MRNKMMNVSLVGLGRIGDGIARPAADRRLGAESVRRQSAGARSGKPTQSDRAAQRKRERRATMLVGLLATVFLPCAASVAAPKSGCHQHFGPAIHSLFELDVLANGVTRTADGRTFVPVQPISPAPTPRLAEIVGRGGVKPYPDE